MSKANQKFTHTKQPKGKITSNIIGNGDYRHPDDIGMVSGSQQYVDQMKRHLKPTKVGETK